MALEVKFNDLHFQYQLRASQNACLVQIWWLQPKSMTSYHADKPNFLEFWVKKAKMPLKVKVSDPFFPIPTESIPWRMFGANLVIPAQICDELSCGQGKIYGQMDGRADRQTDRWTDAGNDNTPSAWKANG